MGICKNKMNKKNLSQKTLSEKMKWLGIEFSNLICLIFNVFFVLLFLFCLFSTFVTLLGIFSIRSNWDAGIQFADKLYFWGNVTKYKIADLVNVLGVCLSGVLFPIITLHATVFTTFKTNEQNISELLAESKHIKFYFISFPFGSWHNLSSTYQKDVIAKYKTNKPLSRQDCCLHLFFEGKNFQTYGIEIIKVGMPLSVFNNEKILFGKEQQHGYYFVSDATGVEGQKNNRGTNISLVFGQDAIFKGEKVSTIIKENLLNPFKQNKKIYFEIKFNQLRDSLGSRWKRAIDGEFFPFLLIKWIYESSVRFNEKNVCHKITLCLNNFEPTDDRNAQYKFDIYDIDIETVRRKSWKPDECIYLVKTIINKYTKKSKETVIKEAKRQAEKLHLSEFKILHSDGTESTVILKK